jgi:hypothetical protein
MMRLEIPDRKENSIRMRVARRVFAYAEAPMADAIRSAPRRGGKWKYLVAGAAAVPLALALGAYGFIEVEEAKATKAIKAVDKCLGDFRAAMASSGNSTEKLRKVYEKHFSPVMPFEQALKTLKTCPVLDSRDWLVENWTEVQLDDGRTVSVWAGEARTKDGAAYDVQVLFLPDGILDIQTTRASDTGDRKRSVTPTRQEMHHKAARSDAVARKQ